MTPASARRMLLALSTTLLLANCGGPTGPADPDNTSPSLFSANAGEIRFDRANIAWTAANDPDGDPVTYAVYLNGLSVGTNLTAMTYPLTGLAPETSYTGYVEARDGRGGTSRADFAFATEPEEIVREVDISIVEKTAGTAFNIDAVFRIAAVSNARSYRIEVLSMNPNSSPSQIGKTYTWTPATNTAPLIQDGSGSFVFYLGYGAGVNTANAQGIAQARAFYAGVTGKARVTITIGR